MHDFSLDAVALVLSLCFAMGLNTYGCLFLVAGLGRLGWVTLPAGLSGLEHAWVLGGLGLFACGELVADKVLGLDVLWNVLHSFIRLPLAGLVAFAAAGALPVGMRVEVSLLGMVFAAAAHGAKLALRVTVISHPEPISNVVLSLGEDGIAFGLGCMALLHSAATATAVAGMTAGLAVLGWRGFKQIRRGWARRFEDRRVSTGSMADRGATSAAMRRDETLRFALRNSVSG